MEMLIQCCVIHNNQESQEYNLPKTMIFNQNYNPFMNFTNYSPYFYYIPSQQYNVVDVSNCLTSSPNSEGQKLINQQESDLQVQTLEENLPCTLVCQIDLKEGESSSLEKISIATHTSTKKKENSSIAVSKNKEVQLEFRIQWKNQNRNIVPNLINQMISYLLKKIKSQKLIHQIFKSLSHNPSWTEKKFYLYMKKIKESITHYVNQNVILKFLEIHEPKCELYDYDEQLFYMKVSRIAIIKFLQNDAILISLTSNRMSHAKRQIHLIAREALLKKFMQLCHQAKQ